MNVREGSCLCGAVRYTVKDEPQATVICHCTHCQKASGSAFSVNLLVREADYEQTGETKFLVDIGDSGTPSYRHFCGNCGSPVLTKASNLPGIVLVKAGTLDDKAGIRPRAEIYTDCAVAWHVSPEGTSRFTQAPPA